MASEVRLGDCLKILRELPSEFVDMAYADPPFFTQKTHSLLTRDKTIRYEFSDQWSSRNDYVDFLFPRIKEIRRVLKNSGSLFFHCDSTASHHIRPLLDDVFGDEMFRSEIIWSFRRWSNAQNSPIPSHQTIFFYSKTDNYRYNQLFEDYSPSTNVDQILQRRARDSNGVAIYARDQDGKVINDGHKKGVPIGDVWDIPFLNPKAKERVGYPTQKPVLLLERIITLGSSPGDLVLDPFVGSGTTLVAAELLGRNSLGCDVLPEAVELTKKRIEHPFKTSSELLRKGRKSYAQCDSDALAFLHGLSVIPVQRNRGIDAILNSNPGEKPILIRIQRKGEVLADAADALYAAGKSKQPASLVLVITDPIQPGTLFDVLSPDILFVNSTAAALIERLQSNSEVLTSLKTALP